MATLLDDPLTQEMKSLGLQAGGLWTPEQEQARKDISWGDTKQKMASRYGQAGLTGSSDELNAYDNAAKNFELDWAARKPAQIQQATQTMLPIDNFLNTADLTSAAITGYDPLTGLPTMTNKNQQDQLAIQRQNIANQQSARNQSILSSALSSLGLPQWLSSTLFGVGSGGTGSTSSGGGLVGQGLSSAWNWLTGGSSLSNNDYSGLTGYTGDYDNSMANLYDMLDSQSFG